MVLLIPTNKTYQLRLDVLRDKGMPIASVQFPTDSVNGAFHLGYFVNQDLVGVASFAPSNITFPKHQNTTNNPYQLRGMATKKEFQGHGIGKQLLHKAHQILSILGCDLIWANARTSALPFYTKLGYQTFGKEFLIPNVGPHYVVALPISNSNT